MVSSKSILALAPFLPLITAIPNPLSTRQTCGSKIEPHIIQFMNESSPGTTYESQYSEGGQVTIFQNVESDSNGNIKPTERIYTVLAFPDIPSNANTCQLSVYIPTDYPISTVPAGSAIPPLDIHTFGVDQLGNDPFENNWDWNTAAKLDNPAETLFGTVTMRNDASTQVINSAVCPSGESNTLAFMLQIAEGVDREAGLGYNWFSHSPHGVGLVGFFLTYDC